MTSDHTQYQTPEARLRASEMSQRRSHPPTEVPGYEAQRFLGAGAYGEVWVALDRNTGRQVAIKFYAHRGGVDWSLLSREVEKLVFLSADRYVVQLLDVGWDADPPYYVMEYIENGSLDDRLRRDGPFVVGDAVEIFREIATGLSHAHNKGVLHCDLKPANVLLDQDDKPRLADFGQSRLSDEQSPALGTLFYMAPEQADLEAVPDARWDVYALGAVLYCMVVGEPPHRSNELVGQLDATTNLRERLAKYRDLITYSPRATQHRRVPHMDRALADIIDRCLAPHPKHRYPHVPAVLESLARRESVRVRRPLLLLGLLGPLLLLLTMFFFGYRAYQQAIRKSKSAVTERAVDTNRFAAQFVARNVSYELQRRFLAVEQAAADNELKRLIRKVTDDPQAAQWLDTLRQTDIEPNTYRAAQRQLIASEIRRDLQSHLDGFFADFELPSVASWFVTDAHGTFLAATFKEPPVSSPLAKNFAYRTYFHGGDEDLAEDARPQQPIGTANLSAVFQSTASNQWKVAISTPVIEEGKTLAVVALTVELGKFVRFEKSDKQFAVLVDARPGKNQGIILEHPLFERLLQAADRLPDKLSRDKTFQVDLANLDGEGTYLDPMRHAELGDEYEGSWIVGTAPVQWVKSSRSEVSRQLDTGLLLLVQEKQDAATEAVVNLGEGLVREGLKALATVLLVTVALWAFVFRVRRRRGHRSSRSSDSVETTLTPIHVRDTMEAPGTSVERPANSEP